MPKYGGKQNFSFGSITEVGQKQIRERKERLLVSTFVNPVQFSRGPNGHPVHKIDEMEDKDD